MQEKLELITRNLQEIIGHEELEAIVKERPLSIYWGTATTGKPHIAYFLPILKIYDFLLAGCEVKILLADIHAFLDNMKAPIDMIGCRAIYYEKLIKAMLRSLGLEVDVDTSEFNKVCEKNIQKTNNINDVQDNIQLSSDQNALEKENAISKELDKIKIDLNGSNDDSKLINTSGKLIFVKGSDYQLSKEYTMDLYKLTTFTTQHDAKKAGSQVVKQIQNPLLSALIYPPMQALDEEYLKVDAQFGGSDQRKIFTFAMKYLPMIGYNKRIHLMNGMIPGLNSEKMSSSDEFGKIDLLDTEEIIKKKIKKSFCEEGNRNTGLMYLLEYIIFPLYKLKNKALVFKRRDHFDIVYNNYDDLEADFTQKIIHPADLKENVAFYLEFIIKPVRDEMEAYKDLTAKAYASTKKHKKNKK
ncbi:hypothetical protein COBT_002729 [Conglomerata obtusa]